MPVSQKPDRQAYFWLHHGQSVFVCHIRGVNARFQEVPGAVEWKSSFPMFAHGWKHELIGLSLSLYKGGLQRPKAQFFCEESIVQEAEKMLQLGTSVILFLSGSGILLCLCAAHDNVTLHPDASEHDLIGYSRVETVVFTKMSKSYQSGGILYLGWKDFDGYPIAPSTGQISRRKRAAGGTMFSLYSCCRGGKNVMTRTKTANGYLSIETTRCNNNYCRGCQDAATFCSALHSRSPNLCNTAFMLHNCPKSCSICTEPTVATPGPLRNVVIYQKPAQPIDKFKYLLSSSPAPGNGFRRTSNFLKSFSMYIRPTAVFAKKVYFCFRHENDGDFVTLNPCPTGYRQRFALYGRDTYITSRRVILIYNEGKQSLLSTSKPCCGFAARPQRFFFVNDVNQAGGLVPTTTVRPPRPAPTAVQVTPRPQVTTRPGNPGPPPTTARSGMTEGQRQCLDAHNYFRSKHNTAPLIWDDKLAASASAWARHLSLAAPEDATQLRPGYNKTPAWPHSVSGSKDRPWNVGENIALIPRTASQRETVGFWYSEIFDYNPVTGRTTVPGKPIGHLTQMLWKSTTRIGCAKASNSKVQAYVVAHYKLKGNFRNTVLSNVMRPMAGTCIQTTCKNSAVCLAYGRSSRCSCGTGREPMCRGTQGCMARCNRNVCTGATSCHCSNGQAVCT